jgi:hypothetical protein
MQTFIFTNKDLFKLQIPYPKLFKVKILTVQQSFISKHPDKSLDATFESCLKSDANDDSKFEIIELMILYFPHMSEPLWPTLSNYWTDAPFPPLAAVEHLTSCQ